jgi:hypothetical protein
LVDFSKLFIVLYLLILDVGGDDSGSWSDTLKRPNSERIIEAPTEGYFPAMEGRFSTELFVGLAEEASDDVPKDSVSSVLLESELS